MKAIQYYASSRSPLELDGVATVRLRLRLRLFRHIPDWSSIADELHSLTENALKDCVVRQPVDFHVFRAKTGHEMCEIRMYVEGMDSCSSVTLLERYHPYLQRLIDPLSADLHFYWH